MYVFKSNLSKQNQSYEVTLRMNKVQTHLPSFILNNLFLETPYM